MLFDTTLFNRRGNENVELVHSIRSLTVGDGGAYTCYAENSVNSSSQIVTIAVTPGKSAYHSTSVHSLC